MIIDWLVELFVRGVEWLRSLILGQADKRWSIVLVIVLAVVGICVMLAKMFSENFFGIMKVVAAVAVAIFIIRKMKL